jgi:RNA polymerase sigma factor (sigma-70 family)
MKREELMNGECESRLRSRGDERVARRGGSRALRARDEAWLDRLQNGEEPAFAEFYADYRGSVEAFIRKRVPCGSDVEDLAQETFLQASRSIGRFGRRSSLSTWLLGIARNVCRHHFRSTSRWMVGGHSMSSSTRDQPEDARIEARVDARRQLDRIEKLIDERRGAEGASIFELRFVEGKSTAQIASRTGKSADAVKMNIRRSRLVIAQHLVESQSPGIEELAS